MEIEKALDSDVIEVGKEATEAEVTEDAVEKEHVDCSNQCSDKQESGELEKGHCSTSGTDDIELLQTVKNLESSQSSPLKSPEERQNSIYHIKWISQNNQKTPIITQNENGPCPLIAIMNVLILKGRVELPLTVDIVTSEKLMQQLSDCILDSVPKNIPEGTQRNYEQNVHDAMMVLPKLQTGLDVNVRFTGIQDFEYTPECVIFDLLSIPLYHGWLVDPQFPDVVHAVGKCSYNQLVERIINFSSSHDADKVAEAMAAKAFLDRTASQLTYHGLCELTSSLRDAELCVLFRNNHFISLIKHDNLLYQLVTDQGFLNENVVWESLNNIEGDSQFFDSNFILVPPKPVTSVAIPEDIPPDQRIDQDFLVALSLQEEQNQQQKSDFEWEEYKKKSLGAAETLPDEELARRLQEEENRANAVNRVPPQMASPSQLTGPVSVSLTSVANRSRSREKSGEVEAKDHDQKDMLKVVEGRKNRSRPKSEKEKKKSKTPPDRKKKF